MATSTRPAWRAERRRLHRPGARILGERATELHAPIEQRLSELVNRGRSEGVFRSDVPVPWLITVYFALVHAAGRQVANGASTANEAEQFLLPTLLGAFGAPTR